MILLSFCDLVHIQNSSRTQERALNHQKTRKIKKYGRQSVGQSVGHGMKGTKGAKETKGMKGTNGDEGEEKDDEGDEGVEEGDEVDGWDGGDGGEALLKVLKIALERALFGV